MVGGIDELFVIKHDSAYFIFGTRKRGFLRELALEGNYANLSYVDSEDPYCEAASNSIFFGPDGKLWSSCHYQMYDKRPYRYSQSLQDWEKVLQLGIEPVYFKNGRYYIASL